MTKIVFHTPPVSTNHAYRYSCVGRVPRMYMTQKGQDLKKECQIEAKRQWNQPPLEDDDVSLDIIYYHKDHRKRDVTNFDKLIIDSLQGVVFHDDAQISDIFMRKEVDTTNPRVEIIVNV